MTVAAPSPTRKRTRSPRAVSSTVPSPQALLAWYDRHRRRLPWRAAPGAKADPYRVWLSEIMLQQTTVKAVAPYYAAFLARFPGVAELAAAPLEEVLRLWAGLGYYARARNLHACARVVVERHGGHFPGEVNALRDLPGIGPYTAAAIAAIAFNRRAVPVDGNVERVVARLFAVEAALPEAKPKIRQLAEGLDDGGRPGDFAQALMDLGATICTPKNPVCSLCPWSGICAVRRRGDRPENFPRRLPKAEGRLRRGAAFVVRRADWAVLVRTRPAKGLLGAMTEVPTSAWTPDFDAADALAAAPSFAAIRWRRLPGRVTHVFTHFPLELIVYTAKVSADVAAPAGMRFVAATALDSEALPTVMRKVLAHARTAKMPRLA